MVYIVSSTDRPYPERVETRDQTLLDINSQFGRFHAYPTPMDIIKYGLRGLPKQFPMTGEPIDEEFVTPFLRSTISEIEQSGLVIDPIMKTQQDDFHEGMFQKNYFALLTTHFPVMDVESVILVYPHSSGDQRMFEYVIPREWLTWDRNKINVIASTGLLAPQMSGATYNAPLAIWSAATYRPNAFTFTYKAGFEQDKLPDLFWKFIIDKATFDLLVDVGPMLFPVSSMSTGIDSVSQSASLPGPQVLMYRLKELEKRNIKNWNLINGYFGQTINISFAGL